MSARSLALIPIIALSVSCAGEPFDPGDEGADPDQFGLAVAEHLPPRPLDRPDEPVLDPWVEPEVYVEPAELVPGGLATIRYRGELADRAGVTVRYGYNGWNELPEASGATVAWLDGDQLFLWEDELVSADEGWWEAEIQLPEGSRALHFTFWTDDLREEDGLTEGSLLADDNGGLEYHASVRFPYVGPFLTWTDDASPGQGVVVNWEGDVPELGVVTYGVVGEDGEGTRVAGSTRDTMHHVPLQDLEPGSTCWYQVEDSRGRASEVYELTVPDPAAVSTRFLVMSDMQDNGERGAWEEVAAHVAASEQGADLLLVAGDMAANDTPGLWWTFFDGGRPLLPGIPILPAPGNHDTPTNSSHEDTTSFDRYFPLPSGPRPGAYALDMGPVRFLLVNSEIPEELSAGGLQYVWLEDLLGGGAGGRFVVAAWHVPPYNAGARHTGRQWESRPLTALFEGSVDWVFSGHEHLGQRTEPVIYSGVLAPSGTYGRSDDDGVGYTILPPAGHPPGSQLVPADGDQARFRDVLAWPYVDESLTEASSELGYVTVDVGADQVEITTWGLGLPGGVTSPRAVDTVSVAR